MEKLAEPDISVAPGLPKSAAGKTDTKGGKVASVKLPTYEPKGEPLAIPVSFLRVGGGVGFWVGWGLDVDMSVLFVCSSFPSISSIFLLYHHQFSPSTLRFRFAFRFSPAFHS